MLDFFLLFEYDLINMSILKILPSILIFVDSSRATTRWKERIEMLINELIRLIDQYVHINIV